MTSSIGRIDQILDHMRIEQAATTTTEQCEVSRIMDAQRHENGVAWRFLIEFNDMSREWVNDDASQSCEYLMNEFIHNQMRQSTAYCISRVSSRSQAGINHVSLDTQEQALRSAALSIGASRIHSVSMTSSAFRGPIPEPLRIIGEAARQGDILFFYRADRCSRNIFTYLEFLESLHNKGVRICSLMDNHVESDVVVVNNTPLPPASSQWLWYDLHKLRFVQLIVDAQRESESLSQRVKASIRFRRQRGDQTLGSTRYGFATRREPATQRLIMVANKVEQARIAMIRRRYHANTEGGYIAVAEFMNRHRWFNRQDKPWTMVSVGRIVQRLV
jgi:DNA invertase Pin-like site-specific DNA recombinase